MGILDKFAFFQKSTPKVDNEIVSSIGTSNFWLLDGVLYNQDKITLETYDRIFRHYQVKACLNIIKYSLQQVDWFVESDDEEVKKVVTYALEKIWNQLIRSTSKALRYGFSPAVKVFTLDEIDGKQYVVYKKIKDLKARDCQVIVDEFGNFNGFWYRRGNPMFQVQVAPEYSFWYVHDSENNNLYGNPMLRDVYKPWFFSEKIHHFANRYYERFGEPLVIGRAPGGNSRVKDAGGVVTTAQNLMANVIDSIRSHSSAQLPSDKDEANKDYLFDIKYLESQMRGFDFENYLQRLDMEIVRGLLVPAMMFQDSERGAYALGSAQIEAFYTNLMGMMDNIKDYVETYITPQLLQYNFDGTKKVKFTYEPLSTSSRSFINLMITTLIQTGKIMPDLDQMSDRTGFKYEKIIEPAPIANTTSIKKEIVKNNAEIQAKVIFEAEKMIGRALMDKEKKELTKLKEILESEIDE